MSSPGHKTRFSEWPAQITSHQPHTSAAVRALPLYKLSHLVLESDCFLLLMFTKRLTMSLLEPFISTQAPAIRVPTPAPGHTETCPSCLLSLLHCSLTDMLKDIPIKQVVVWGQKGKRLQVSKEKYLLWDLISSLAEGLCLTKDIYLPRASSRCSPARAQQWISCWSIPGPSWQLLVGLHYLWWVFPAVSWLCFLRESSKSVISACLTFIQPTAMLSPRRWGVNSGAPLSCRARGTCSHPQVPVIPPLPTNRHPIYNSTVASTTDVQALPSPLLSQKQTFNQEHTFIWVTRQRGPGRY